MADQAGDLHERAAGLILATCHSRFGLAAALVLAGLAITSPASAQFRFNYQSVPTRESVDNVWPAEAKRAGVGGSAAMVCDIERDGRPSNCQIISEQPAGMGFGEALKQLLPVVRLYGMNPKGCAEYFRHMIFAVDWPLASAAPTWKRWPNAHETAAVYPLAPKMPRQPGEAAVECDVLAGGDLAGCRIVHEAPTGVGYGSALLSLTPKMALKASTPERPLPKRIVVPMNFVPSLAPMMKCQSSRSVIEIH